jgi:hypothetical protein
MFWALCQSYRWSVSGECIGDLGSKSLLDYIRSTKCLKYIASDFGEDCRRQKLFNGILDALSTRTGIESVYLFLEHDQVDIRKLEQFFSKTSKSLVHFQFVAKNILDMEMSFGRVLSGLTDNMHIMLESFKLLAMISCVSLLKPRNT